MSENNWWLHKKLKEKGANVAGSHLPLIQLRHNGIDYLIYTPGSDEYIITADTVATVKQMGGNTISYPTTWCRASQEAIEFGKSVGVRVLPHGAIFSLVEK